MKGQQRALTKQTPARQVAGLNVLSLVNSHAAAALQYGIDRKYDNRSENVVFYDVGSSSVEARSSGSHAAIATTVTVAAYELVMG